MFESVTIDGASVHENDWVGAFNGATCVGSYRWQTSACGGGVCTVALMGYSSTINGTEDYMTAGDIPTFKIWDSSEDKYYDAEASEDIGWANGSYPMLATLSAISGGSGDSEATISLAVAAGWNWFSTNMLSSNMGLNNVLNTVGDNAIYIKSQSGYADYYDDYGWYGNFSELDNLAMFKIYLNNTANIGQLHPYLVMSSCLRFYLQMIKVI